MRTATTIVAQVMAAIAAGCGVHMPAPVLDSVEPDRGWNGEDTVLTIHGRGFYPQVEFDASRRGGADLDRTFEAWLEGPGGEDDRVLLTGTSAEDYETLRAIVRQGAVAGVYDLVVAGPTGRIGRLPAAFTVADTRADRLLVDAPSVTWQVNTFAQVDIFLVDPLGERVFTDLPVELQVAPEPGQGPVDVTFGSGGLDDQVVGGDGDRIVGRLGADGFARVLLSTPDPGTYTITASSLSEGSRLDSGALKLLFEPGDALSLDIRLPDQGFAVQAGEVFELELELRDQYDNPVPNTLATVALRNACNSWLDLLQVRGVTRVPVQILTATGPASGCAADAIVTDEASGVHGHSEPFEVHPGPPTRFTVEVGPNPVVAGYQQISRITPVDSYGNQAAWSGALSLHDSVGGLGPATCGAVGGATICATQPTVAGGAVVLHATDDHGIAGVSAPYSVLPSPIVGGVGVEVHEDTWRAGEPHLVDVVAYDIFGNVMDPAPLGAMALTPGSDDGQAECDFDAYLTTGEARFVCRSFQVRPTATLSATVQGIEGTSDPFEVINGPLGAVEVVAPLEVEAGAPFAIDLTGADSWGHPYVDQLDPVVDLAELRGTLQPPSTTLNADGTATSLVTVTAAGETRIEVRQGGALLGQSAPILVRPAATEALRVSVDAPWAWVGEPVAVRVESVDTYGNRTPHAGPVTVSSLRTDTPPVQVTLVDGVADLNLTFTEPAFDDVLEADDPDGLTGASAPLHVVSDCGLAGPTADLTFAGLDHAVACFDPVASQAQVVASFSGSVAGTAPIASHVLARTPADRATSAQPTVLLALPEVGIHPLAGLVVQVDGCADEIASVAYVGLDDGEPVGPLALSFGDPSVDAQVGSTTVEVSGALDCAGDPASGGRVKLRATLGELVGPVATGAGLAQDLDAQGDAALVFDAAPVDTHGTATVHAWVDSGAAAGVASVAVLQDHLRPVVLEQTPSGRHLGPVDEIRLTFSESLLPSSIVASHFSIHGPGAVGALTVALDRRDTEVVLLVDPPLDGSAGAWTVEAVDVRDLAGNRMDGAFVGSSSAWEGQFGDVDAGPGPVDCLLAHPTSGVFRPDGDDGPDIEADTVEIEALADARYAWWVLTVVQESTDNRRARHHVPMLDTAATLIWDGRDQSGRVVDNGDYRLTVEVVDIFGNRSPACTVGATVDNRLGTLP